ncbi:hypothetical protein [Thermomonospora cellulosilytica]|uniref:Rubrerythrin n=1 Tax=Thermomonospora cellulosilytica TaxID=1411118 RepID=A0A7W3N006_9ACTN|nr:hypothetical protein [Thermomonospora cellulosilytica]MBA9005003.1 rubrerythrin [Thermomonospora cellulosilytica]
MNEDEIVSAAHMMRLLLPELVGDDAQEVGRELDDLLARAHSGEPVKEPLLRLVFRYEGTRTWMEDVLNSPRGTARPRKIEVLPGDRDTGSGTLYVCPKCGEEWERDDVLEPVPRCAKDGVDFIPKR